LWHDVQEKLRHINQARGRRANMSSWNTQQEWRWQRRVLKWLALRRKAATEVPAACRIEKGVKLLPENHLNGVPKCSSNRVPVHYEHHSVHPVQGNTPLSCRMSH
jgi:hypothetical protein